LAWVEKTAPGQHLYYQLITQIITQAFTREDGKMANKLAGAISPYLQQHAENPVDWMPWGEEALARARAENKPLLLSIGYAACHWCHVMAHESFENADIAAAMNAHYINIKIGIKKKV
jgi:uncharacterized protein YyaL (SSP411 family)